jgi:hypothetical protein
MDISPVRTPRRRLIFFVLSLALYALTIVLGSTRGLPDVLQEWTGYYTLALDADYDRRVIDGLLEQAGVHECIGIDDLRFDFASWTTIERLTKQSFNSKVPIEKDLRVSQWYELAHKLFFDERSERGLVYVPWSGSALGLSQALEPVFRNYQGEYQIIELNSQDSQIVFYLVLGAALMLLIMAPLNRWAVLGLVLPWTFVSAAVGPILFTWQLLAALIMVLASARIVPLIRHYVYHEAPKHFFWESLVSFREGYSSVRSMIKFFSDHKVSIWLLVYIVVAILVFLVSLTVHDSRLVWANGLLLFLSWPSIWVWSAYIHSWKQKKHEHKLFMPVPILKIRSGLNFWQALRFGVLQFATLVLGLIMPLVLGVHLNIGIEFDLENMSAKRSVSDLRVPVPLHGPNSGYDLNNLKDLYEKEKGLAILPNPGMALAHRVFQERWALESAYTMPDHDLPELGHSIWHLRYSDKLKTAKEELVFRFDQRWFDGYRRSLPATDPEYLLYSRGGNGLAYTTEHGVYSTNEWSLGGFFLNVIFAVIFLVVRIRNRRNKLQNP